MSGLRGVFSSPRGNAPRPRTALVVDSDFGNVRNLARALREEGLDVFEASTFQEGKFLWSTRAPDVLIVDIRLGQFNGLQLLMRARSDRPDLRAIITSSVPDPVLEAETHRFGGVFMVKPIDPRQVLNALTGITTSGRVPTPVTPPYLLERRRIERRVVTVPTLLPDRRVAARRTTAQS